MSGEPGNGEEQIHNPETSGTPKAGDKSTGGRGTQPPASGKSSAAPNFENPADVLRIAAEGDMREATKDNEGLPEDKRISTNDRIAKTDQTKSIPEDVNNAWSSILDSIQERDSLDNDLESDVITKFQDTNTSQEQAMIILNQSSLSGEVKGRIISKLKQAKDLSTPEEPSDGEKMQMQAGGHVMEKILGDKEKEAEAEIKKEAEIIKKDPSHSKEHKERFERTKDKIHELRKKMDEFFHPEDPLKAWTTRGGKVIYYALLTAFIFIVIEMNLFNKMAGAQSGGH